MTRSFTVPPKLTVSTRTNPTPEIGAADGIETLYVHPSASIIKFTTGGSRPGSSLGSPRAKHADDKGTIPWTYPTESTVAVGPMEIYRVPGSVSFLHSGALLHAILPRSQCWCVDGVSKFAFRVLPETYYRIELPGETTEDLELVEALKVTLQKVLFYERTPCPFTRGFTVDLPVEEIKIKKRNSVRGGPAKKWRLQKTYSWKPEGWEEEEELKKKLDPTSSQSGEDKRPEPSDEDEVQSDQSGEEEQDQPEAARTTPAKLRPVDLQTNRSVTAPVQMQQALPSRVRSRVQAVETVDRAEKAEKVRFSVEAERRSSVRAKRLSAIPVDMPPSPPDSSAGAEPQIEGEASDIADGPGEVLEESEENDVSNIPDSTEEDNNIGEAQSSLESDVEADADLLHSRQRPLDSQESKVNTESQHSDPGKSKDELRGDTENNASQHSASREEPIQSTEEPTTQPKIGPSTSGNRQADIDSSASKAPAPTRAVSEDPYAAIQARIQARRSIGGSTTSFQPASNPPTRKSSSSNVSSVSIAAQRPSKSNRAQRQQSVTAALVNKACAVFLGPPAHLVTMMLRIAARISSGAFGSNSMFFVESPIGSPRRIPGSFYLEEEEDKGWQSEEEDWEEDDFGVPLKSPVRISGLRERARRHGWEME